MTGDHPLALRAGGPLRGRGSGLWSQPDDGAERFASEGGVGRVAFPRSDPAAADSPTAAGGLPPERHTASRVPGDGRWRGGVPGGASMSRLGLPHAQLAAGAGLPLPGAITSSRPVEGALWDCLPGGGRGPQ
jgi:hypothetical protein